MSTTYENTSLRRIWERKFLWSSDKWWNRDSLMQPFHFFLDTVTSHLLKPVLTNTVHHSVVFVWTFIFFRWALCFPGLYNNKSRSWSLFRGMPLLNLYFHCAHLHKAFHAQIISDLKKTPAVIVEIDSNPLRTGAICIFNWIQCYISGDYSIKVGTNIRSKVGTFHLDFGKQ